MEIQDAPGATGGPGDLEGLEAPGALVVHDLLADHVVRVVHGGLAVPDVRVAPGILVVQDGPGFLDHLGGLVVPMPAGWLGRGNQYCCGGVDEGGAKGVTDIPKRPWCDSSDGRVNDLGRAVWTYKQ